MLHFCSWWDEENLSLEHLKKTRKMILLHIKSCLVSHDLFSNFVQRNVTMIYTTIYELTIFERQNSLGFLVLGVQIHLKDSFVLLFALA